MSMTYQAFLKTFQKRKERTLTMSGSSRNLSNLNLHLSNNLFVSLNLHLKNLYLPIFSSKIQIVRLIMRYNFQITIYLTMGKRSIALKESIKAQSMVLLLKLSILRQRQKVFKELSPCAKLKKEHAQLPTLPCPGNLMVESLKT